MDQNNTTEGPALGGLRIGWMADLHYMHAQYADSSRSKDIFDASIRAVEDIAKKCDVIIIAGDILNVSKQTPRTIGQLMQLDQKLQRLGMTALCVTGNHDLCAPTWLATLFPGRDDVTAPGIIPVDGKSFEYRGFRMLGIYPHEADAFRKDRDENIEFWREHDVLIYHGFVKGITPIFTKNKNVLELGDMPTGGRIKFLALGDIHAQQFLHHEGVLVGYPGTLEMIRINEPPEKSVPIVYINAEKAGVVETVPAHPRAFVGGKIHTEADLEQKVKDLQAKADRHPLVVLEYARDVPGVLERIYSVVDPHRSVVRVTPLPRTTITEAADRMTGGAEAVREEKEEERLSLDHFLREKLAGDAELQEVGSRLLRNPDTAHEEITAFIEQNKFDTRAVEPEFA